MNSEEKMKIRILRQQGLSIGAIAKELCLPIGTVKSWCYRNQVQQKGRGNIRLCEQCGEQIPVIPGRKHKRFCSDKCRMTWWNAHRELVRRKTAKRSICIFCGREFISYAKQNQKYCSHACYIMNRFGKERESDV